MDAGTERKVVFLQDAPRIVVGASGDEYHVRGPFRAGEEAWLPGQIAEILVRKGVAAECGS